MNKKIFAAIALFSALTVSVTGLTACTENIVTTDQVTVTFYDATDSSNLIKLDEVKVDKGSTVESYTPTKEGGYEFVDWFAVPSKNHVFDFTTAITEDTSIYGGFTLYKEDTREFYVVGSGTSELLYTSNWGKVITDAHKLTKASGKNEYSITMDLKAGDEFQFARDTDWSNKRGYGYLSTITTADGTEVFESQGSVYDDSLKGSNIKVKYSGNYTLTLKTYPNEDYYNTEGTGYTEERKEIYNIGLYDKITWVRNGDVLNDTVTVTNYYIKGANITGWKDMYNTSTQMTADGDTHTLSVYLKEGEEFMFTSLVTMIEDGTTSSSVGAEYIKANALTDASKTYVGGDTNNMTALTTGQYTFTYNSTSKELSVTVDTSVTPASYDYYLDGNFNGGNYGDFITSPASFKLAETAEGSGVYAIKNVTLDEGAELLLRAYAAGDTADWSHTHTDYQYAYLAANTAFSAASDTNNNIMVVTAGVYDISFDSYSKMITIVEHVEADPADTLDIYIKGSGINNWSHNFSSEYVMTLSEDKTTYEYVLTVGEDGVQFGLEKHTKGEKEGYGDYLGLSAIGTSGDANSLFNPGSGSNFECSTAGTYKIVYDIATGKVDFYKADSTDVYDIYIKGSGINSWSHGFDSQWLMTLSADGTVYEYTLTVTDDVEFGFEKHAKGETTGYGDYLGLSAIGTSGDANSLFAPESGSNFKCSTAGTYKIVYDIATGKVDFYEVVYDIYIKGSGINSWSHGFSTDYLMTLSADKTTYEYTLTVTDDVEFGFEKHAKGETTGYGDYLGLSAIGTSGDANSLFNPGSGSNFKCSTAGTYKIVYDIATGKVDFYTVSE